mmetsp:Transcript_33692/g.70834  ORF Transcript_33692/g.70834 Transcript_33692/m.70834 type:complete len:389 (-) Transcript_33692:48-1214(-)
MMLLFQQPPHQSLLLLTIVLLLGALHTHIIAPNISIVSAFTYRDISIKACRENSSVEFPPSSSLLGSDDLNNLPLPSLLWSSSRRSTIFNRRFCCLVLRASGSDDNTKGGGGKKKGYRFGDLTKSLIGGSVEKITGKPYEFGDLSRAVDTSIKDKINDLTGNDDYEFGDLSRWVDTKIKGEVNKFTDKDAYKFGDLTKEIVRRVATGEYTLDDLFMLLKALAIFEASISPVAGFLPVKLLVELLNFSLLNDIGGKVTSALAMELDKRLKKSLLGDENYKLGDATKRTIGNAVKSYTGKEEYEFGDVTKKVVSTFADETKLTKNDKKTPPAMIGGMKSANDSLEPNMIEALDTWDTLSETQLKDGLDKIEEYVELVEKDQLGGGNNNKK